MEFEFDAVRRMGRFLRGPIGERIGLATVAAQISA